MVVQSSLLRVHGRLLLLVSAMINADNNGKINSQMSLGPSTGLQLLLPTSKLFNSKAGKRQIGLQ